MPDQQTVFHPDQWDSILASGRLPAIQEWLRANNIDPNDVPVDEEIRLETRDGQRVIVYTYFLRTADGHRYVDPDHPDQAAAEERTVPCLIEPPTEWPQTEDQP